MRCDAILHVWLGNKSIPQIPLRKYREIEKQTDRRVDRQKIMIHILKEDKMPKNDKAERIVEKVETFAIENTFTSKEIKIFFLFFSKVLW
jgi:hypothetical protein